MVITTLRRICKQIYGCLGVKKNGVERGMKATNL